MKGDVVYSSQGEEVVLVDIGIDELVDNEVVRVWDVTLEAGAVHPWHLHHNPYVVLSLLGSDGRMDWLDGSEPRYIHEYAGGAVYRPVSPVHRLTNLGDHRYRNRLVELKDLGELLPQPFDIGEGARSIEGEVIGPRTDDGRTPVIDHPHVRVWTTVVEPGESHELELAAVGHVLAEVEAAEVADDRTGGVRYHAGGRCTLVNEGPAARTWFVLELTYLDHLDTILAGSAR